MKSNLIPRETSGIQYYVDATTPSDIYFSNEILKHLLKQQCELSVTGISKFLRAKSSHYSPILLTWDMTSRCNFDCPFCYIRDNDIHKDITYKEALPVIDDLVSEGLFEVYLSGGECLLLDDFLPIYKHLKEKGVFVTVFTNGSLINDAILACWNDLPPSSVEITLYNNDTSSKPYLSIITLRNMGIKVITKFTLTKTTLPFYYDVKKWTNDNNIILYSDGELFDGLDDKHKNIEKNFSLSYEQKKQFTPHRLKSIESSFKVWTGFPCKSKDGIIQIAPDFSISLCKQMKTRWNLRKTTVSNALAELRTMIDKYKDEVIQGCDGCMYSNRCSMCFANAEFIDGKLYVPSQYCNDLKMKMAHLYK